MRANTAAMTYQCNDFALPYSRSAAPETRAQQLAEYRRRIPQRPITAAEIGGNTEDFCLAWPILREAPPVLPKIPDVPMLAIGGSLDIVFGSNTVPLARMFPRGQAVVVPFGRHSASVSGDSCLQGVVQSFVAAPQRPVHSTCTAETYRALGQFPRTSADLSSLRVAFATAFDAFVHPGPGLRGGTVTAESGRPSVHLDGVRYVSDVAVSGDVRLVDGKISADLTLGTRQHMILSWQAFQATDTVTVTGSVDGRPFTTCLPTT
jgi:hypothetical protein